jgi:prephenate dehydrogenase
MPVCAILGLGLMGGSLGLAVRRGLPDWTVVGYARRTETIDDALALGAIHRGSAHPAEAAAGADLVVGCLPVGCLADALKACLPSLKPDALITDVGSVKAPLARAMRSALDGVRAVYLGSHPICGSERAGIEAASETLYRGAACIVTPEGDEPAAAVEAVEAFWRSLGMVVRRMTPARHDRCLARTSHLPHVAASALSAVAGRDGDLPEGVRGAGLRDATRIAAGPAEVWRDIAAANRDALLEEVRRCREQMQRFENALENRDSAAVEALLNEGREGRLRLEREGFGDGE